MANETYQTLIGAASVQHGEKDIQGPASVALAEVLVFRRAEPRGSLAVRKADLVNVTAPQITVMSADSQALLSDIATGDVADVVIKGVIVGDETNTVKTITAAQMEAGPVEQLTLPGKFADVVYGRKFTHTQETLEAGATNPRGLTIVDGQS